MSTSKSPRERLRAWLDALGMTKAAAGRAFDCSPEHVAYILEGKRSPGLRLAFRIEEVTTIPAADWVRAEEAA